MNEFANFISSSYELLFNSWGLLAAVVVFVLQQFFVPQILDFREILKRARYDVIYYANIFPIVDKKGQIVNSNDLEDAHKELRVIASRLRAHRDDIPLYKASALIGLIPQYEKTELMATEFIGWSNEMYETRSDAQERQKRRKE